MREVYLASDPVNAEIIKDYLVSHGIAAHIRGATLWGGRGDLPADCYPRVWVNQSSDFAQARELLQQFETGQAGAAPWQCQNCDESLSGQFTACWNCGCERP
jgi:hypothetical protein